MKFWIERLGCPKNDVDADYIAGRLIADGHEPAVSADKAEAVIVNTCGFILPAKQESIGEILRYGELRKSGELKKLVAAGCLSQKNGAELLEGVPELDAACGLGQLDAIAAALNGNNGSGISTEREVAQVDTKDLLYLAGAKRSVETESPFAYLKISDGCDRKCTYCVIPQMRGSFRSRPLAEIVDEAKMLADLGKRELILVSQEATLYGADTGKVQLLPLLDELQKVAGIEWIRLMYLHPQMLDSTLIDYLSEPSKALAYYDLPLQHINDDILKRMRRQVRRQKIEAVLAEIRDKRPDSVIRTTFIVGFPGETEEQFSELYQFAEEFGFDRMGAFAYSNEEGSSAALMPDQISEDEKTARLAALEELQNDIASERNERLIGARLEVLVDSAATEEDPAQGRTTGDCPEIDQIVYIQENPRENTQPLKSGDFCPVRVTDTVGLDLITERVSS